MNKKIYFCGAISGGVSKERRDAMRAIVNILENFDCEVLTKFVCFSKEESPRPYKVDTSSKLAEAKSIYEGDVSLLEKADLMIADITQPSTGVGVEIGMYRVMNGDSKRPKVLALYDGHVWGGFPSLMVAGDVEGVKIVSYDINDKAGISKIIADFVTGR